MRTFILLGLLCFSSFAALTTTVKTLTIDGDEYTVGADADGDCAIDDGTDTVKFSDGTCDVITAFTDGTDAWVVLTSIGDINTDAEVSPVATAFDDSILAPADVAAVTATYVIQVDVATTLGEIQWGTVIAGVEDDDTTFGDFTATTASLCDDEENILIKGDTESATVFLPDEDGEHTSVEGDDVYILYNISDMTFESSADELECPEDDEDEDEDDEDDSAGLLSVATVALAFLGLLAL